MNAFSILLCFVGATCSGARAKVVLEVISVSDTHGWVYGHRHRPEYGNYGTLVSYIERVRNKAMEATNSAVLVVDAGDMVEGTGLSDLTHVKGEKILEAASHVDFDLQTVGNHECYYSGTTEYLHANVEKLFKGRYVTTNVFMQETNAPLSPRRYKYVVLPNGLRVLMFGFLFHSNPYDGVYTIPAKEAIQSPEIVRILEEYKYKVDMLLLACHIPTYSPEMSEIVASFRAFYDKTNYKIPIVMIAGHYHQIHNTYCMDGQDKQCFIAEAGCYLRFMQHVTYEMEPISYVYNGSTYFGYQFSSVDYFSPQNFTTANLAERFGLKEQDLMTERGSELLNLTMGWVIGLNLTIPIGWNKNYYSMFKNVTDDDSFFNLWLNGAIPAVFYPTRSMPCLPFPTISSGTARYDFFPGDITLDDCIVAQPSWQMMSTIRGLSAEQISCLFTVTNELMRAPPTLNTRDVGWEVPVLTKYQTPEDPTRLDKTKCYDLLSTFETIKSFLKLLEEGGACYEEGVGPYSVSPYYDQHGQTLNAISVLPKYVSMYKVDPKKYSPYLKSFEFQYADKKLMKYIGVACSIIYFILVIVGVVNLFTKPGCKRRKKDSSVTCTAHSYDRSDEIESSLTTDYS